MTALQRNDLTFETVPAPQRYQISEDTSVTRRRTPRAVWSSVLMAAAGSVLFLQSTGAAASLAELNVRSRSTKGHEVPTIEEWNISHHMLATQRGKMRLKRVGLTSALREQRITDGLQGADDGTAIVESPMLGSAMNVNLEAREAIRAERRAMRQNRISNPNPDV